MCAASPKIEPGRAKSRFPRRWTARSIARRRPKAPPFVEIGIAVRKGQPLCLIEVMKLFTTINSEVDGRVVQIGAENAELVQYGRTLFAIQPAK